MYTQLASKAAPQTVQRPNTTPSLTTHLYSHWAWRRLGLWRCWFVTWPRCSCRGCIPSLYPRRRGSGTAPWCLWAVTAENPLQNRSSENTNVSAGENPRLSLAGGGGKHNDHKLSLGSLDHFSLKLHHFLSGAPSASVSLWMSEGCACLTAIPKKGISAFSPRKKHSMSMSFAFFIYTYRGLIFLPKLVDTTASVPYKTLFFVIIDLSGQLLVTWSILNFFQSA